MVKFLVETLDAEPLKLISEASETGQKKYFLEGTYLQSNLKNRNNRYYPKEILQGEVARYTKEYISKSRGVGELNHPDHPQVNPERICHLITDLKEDGNNWTGRSRVLDTPTGKIVKNLMDEGIGLGVSSRGMGSLSQKQGMNYVQADYKIVCIDVVFDPSAPDAMVQSIMEQREWVWDVTSGDYKLVEDIKKDIMKASSAQLEEAMLSAWSKFLNNL
jgi:hypothetical protein